MCIVIDAITQKHIYIESEIYFFDSREFRDSNLKREAVFSRNFSRNRRFLRTGSRRSLWCSLYVEKDILHESENIHSYHSVFRNKHKRICKLKTLCLNFFSCEDD